MVHIRQPFFSIMTATVYAMLGLLYGLEAVKGTGLVIGSVEINASTAWALTGVMFVMAYFALVHLKEDKKFK